VTNSAPKFLNGRSPANIKIKLGESFEYELTNVFDEEWNELSIISLVKPSFASYSGLKYTLKPVQLSHLGTSLIKGIISDSLLEI
jgi:hypothetical protein